MQYCASGSWRTGDCEVPGNGAERGMGSNTQKWEMGRERRSYSWLCPLEVDKCALGVKLLVVVVAAAAAGRSNRQIGYYLNQNYFGVDTAAADLEEILHDLGGDDAVPHFFSFSSWFYNC